MPKEVVCIYLNQESVNLYSLTFKVVNSEARWHFVVNIETREILLSEMYRLSLKVIAMTTELTHVILETIRLCGYEKTKETLDIT